MRFMKRTLIVQFFLLLLLIVLLGQSLQAALNTGAAGNTGVNDSRAIILQGFNWESYNKDHYLEIFNNSEEIKNAGFNFVWFPPVSYGYDGEGLYPHSRGYIPLSYMNFNSSYGSESELIQAVSKLKTLGVSPIADLVLNHRGVSYYEPGHQGDNNYARFTDFDWGLWALYIWSWAKWTWRQRYR